ncbi:flippase [Treponema brennaborense]|uniref:Polysaccharide biosynthesis protein n=1 Tax=Treponema brennaborense (strain DSM 12168 / CIP 105900 / DD5/3) TaxID=906968 RepID=F4LPS1_TREBD|nr:flippase [Treponema brennaborense]AEE17067.1 polysaccharide biosynthesis protein [Treponema brennaborense DSM 12168]
MITHNSIKRNAFLNMVRTLLSIIFPLITFPYATRILQPEGIGKVQFSASIISYFVMIAGLGIGTYGIRETAKKRDNEEKLAKVTKELFLLNLIPTVIAYILLGIAFVFIPKFNSYRELLIIYSATILFTTLGVEWLYSGLEQYAYITIRQFVFQLISLILLFVLVKQPSDTAKYALISVFANIGANICNLCHSRKYVLWRFPVKLEILQHLKSVFILFGMRIAASLYVSIDTTLLGFFTDDRQVGYYESANKMTRIVVSLITSVTAVMLPRLSFYIEKQDFKSFKDLSGRSFAVTMMFAFPMSAGLFVLSENIILLISGNLFLPAVPVMKVLSLLILAISLSSFFGNQIFLPLGKEKISLYAMLVGAAVNIVLSVMFIKKLGVLGVAVASVIAETSITIFYLIVAIKKSIFIVAIKPLVHYVFASLIMTVVVFFINTIKFHLIIRTFCAVLSGMCIYGMLLFFMRDKTFMELSRQLKNKIYINRR